MSAIRDICGYMLGLAFCVLALWLSWYAWLGLNDMFGWRWAVGGIVACLIMRINFAVLVGLYYYAYNLMAWPMAESVAFALPGLLIIVPGFAVEVFNTLVGVGSRR